MLLMGTRPPLARREMEALLDVRLRLPDFLRPGTMGPEGGWPDRRVTEAYQLLHTTALKPYESSVEEDQESSHSFTNATPHASAVYLLTYCPISQCIRTDSEPVRLDTHRKELLPVRLLLLLGHGQSGVNSVGGGLQVPLEHVSCGLGYLQTPFSSHGLMIRLPFRLCAAPANSERIITPWPST